MFFRFKKDRDLSFEEALSDDWARDLDVAEAPLGSSSFYYTGLVVVLICAVILGRIFILGLGSGSFYRARAQANSASLETTLAPRGMILDFRGEVLADNKSVFLALLDVPTFLSRSDLRSQTLDGINNILAISGEEVLGLLERNNSSESAETIVLSQDLSQDQLVKLKALNLSTIRISSGFQRVYPDGEAFSSVIGYTGLVDEKDLAKYPELTGRDFVGKTGVEAFYEKELRGTAGTYLKIKDARGAVLEEKGGGEAKIGKPLRLSIDAGLEKYFYKRLDKGLRDLGRAVGVGLAINPQDGEVLAMVNLPGFDNNVFVSPSRSDERKALLSAPHKPLFNRAVAGFYTPGSTIKPLHALAALEEGVITSQRTIFSPGYLDVPNPYDPEHPTRFLDWRYQGDVNMAAAIAQSSNVYFYVVGGGAPAKSGENYSDIKGLGINKLNEWWRKFNLGSLTGIDLPGEVKGSLPNAADKEKKTGRPWLLGDTYNISIGQGDLMVTPLQLINYIAAIANGGKIYKPFLSLDYQKPEIISDLSSFVPDIGEVQKGMAAAVTSPVGTAHLLNDLPLKVAAKTGSAQVKNNAEENAFFVGYAPLDNPKIAVLVLIENSREGSLNAVPIAKDVFNWYYENRIKNQK